VNFLVARYLREQKRKAYLFFVSAINCALKADLTWKLARGQISTFLIRGQYLVRRNGIAIMIENKDAGGGREIAVISLRIKHANES
jgi:hypothetical protein